MLHRILSSFGVLSVVFALCVPFVRAQMCAQPPSGLVVWYKGEGNANDSSSNAFHASLGSAGIVAGHVGQAFGFTSQDQSVAIPNNAALFPPTALTIEGWINPLAYSGCSGAYRIFHSVQDTLRGYVTFLNCANGKFHGAVFDSAGTGEQVISNATIATDTYTHFAMTWNGSSIRIYINGALDNVAATTISAIGTNAGQLRIGNSGALGFRGQIDEISLYNRELSSTEVLTIFNAGTAGKCLAPTAAFVSISGYAKTASGRGIPFVRLTLSDSQGNIRTALTNSFGYYSFEGLPSGMAVLSAQGKAHSFVDPVRTLNLVDPLTGVDFIAME